MRIIVFFLLISLGVKAQDTSKWNKASNYGMIFDRLKASKVFLPPTDTTFNKYGFSIIGTTAYIGDGTKWTALSTLDRLYKVADSLSIIISSKGGKVYAGNGLENVNDSTLQVDTLLISTKNLLYKVADSIGSIINGRATFWDVRDIVNDSLNYVRGNFVDLISNQNISGRKSFTREIEVGENNIYDGAINFKNSSNGETGSLKATTITSRQNYELPNNSGTIALTSDITDSLVSVVKYTDTTAMLAPYALTATLSDYVTKATSQTITGAKTVTNNFKIKDDNGTAISDTKLVLENARTATISDTIAVAPYILFSSKTFTSDPSGDYSYGSNDMQWRIRQTLAPAGYVARQDNRLYFDYKNGNAGSWTSAVSISKDGVQGNITGVDQMTLGNFSGNAGKITFKYVGGYPAGTIQAAGNVFRVGDGGSVDGKIEFFNGVVYYGGSATSTGSQLSSTGWAFAKNSNTTFTASALLHLDKNRSTAGNAPIKFTLAGAALLTTPERGALEAMPYRLNYTDSGNQRNIIAYLSDVYKTPVNVADSNYTVVGNEIIIGYTGLTADRTCTLPNPASHTGKSLTLFAKGMNDYDLNFSSSYKPKNLNDTVITSVKGDLPKHGVDVGSAIEGFSMKLVSFNNEWVILNYFTHYK